MGLSCYLLDDGSVDELKSGFNALMGLSCYDGRKIGLDQRLMFQCPYGLELLRQECPIF